MAIFDSLKVNCYGREQEREQIIAMICGDLLELKPAVLLYGDSGIGKTTLLSSICELLPGRFPDVLIGHYAVKGGETDPLLFSLNALIKSIYTTENWSLQPSVIRESFKRKLSDADLTSFRRFLGEIAAKLVETHIGEIGKVILKEIGQAVISLDPKPEEALLKPSSLDEFSRLIELLSDALPSKVFLFIIDNLNAASQSGLDTIESYLSRLVAYPQVRVVLSWKREADSAQRFHRLLRRVKECGGKAEYLKHVASASTINEWLRSEFYWYSQLTETEQQRVIKLTGGLPEVIARWKRYSLDTYNHKTLERIAREVRDGKYSEIVELIGQAEPLDQRLL